MLPRICYHCQQPGLIAADCPLKKPPMMPNMQPQQQTMMNSSYQPVNRQPQMMTQAMPYSNQQVTPQTSNHVSTQDNAQVNMNSHQEEYYPDEQYEQEDDVATEETEFYTFAIDHITSYSTLESKDEDYWTFVEDETPDNMDCLDTDYMPEDYDSIDIALISTEVELTRTTLDEEQEDNRATISDMTGNRITLV